MNASEKSDPSGSPDRSSEPVVDDAVRSVGKPVRRRGSRRVVMLSDVDAQRIKAGEFESAEEVLHASDRRTRQEPRQAAKKSAGRNPEHKSDGERNNSRETSDGGSSFTDKPVLSARDREILADVPPHFGNL
ncbi:hypothetical protein J2S70_000755 [Trueperella bonasi]|uniref:Uncharacterized protein n=1 Tax=Trueperella bonasi TaxID=312286 RepID=A0ABT9NGP8_9ACTO|nr:hypothetical protein [Trueperella bonasi]MDP9806173.1 hypothetical protein [Trueperella bonasi]